MKRIVFLFVLAAGIVFFASCDEAPVEISGTWVSVSIDNPAPLFKGLMPDIKRGSVTVTFTGKGTFTWTNTHDNKTIKGAYVIKGKKVVLNTNDDEKPLVLRCRIKECRLILKTEDEFTFVFEKRDAKQ